MSDAAHYFGQDWQLAANGDILLASGTLLTQQRVLRRLMTNASGYIWHLAYGAGLPAKVGLKTNQRAIQSIVRSQIFQEATVSAVPAPVISTTVNATGTVILTVTYTDTTTNLPVTLVAPITSP